MSVKRLTNESIQTVLVMCRIYFSSPVSRCGLGKYIFNPNSLNSDSGPSYKPNALYCVRDDKAGFKISFQHTRQPVTLAFV